MTCLESGRAEYHSLRQFALMGVHDTVQIGARGIRANKKRCCARVAADASLASDLDAPCHGHPPPGQWAAAGLHRHAGSCVAAGSAGGRPCASPVVCKNVQAAAVSVASTEALPEPQREFQRPTRASPQPREGCARRRELPGGRRGRPGPSAEAAPRQRSAIVHTARWQAADDRATQQLAPGSSWAVNRKLCAERETSSVCVSQSRVHEVLTPVQSASHAIDIGSLAARASCKCPWGAAGR